MLSLSSIKRPNLPTVSRLQFFVSNSIRRSSVLSLVLLTIRSLNHSWLGAISVMKFLTYATTLLGTLTAVVGAVPTRSGTKNKYIRDGPGPCHTPSNRECWASGFDIYTDYEVNTPNTGVTRKVKSSSLLLK